jgi:heme/copper-type cytochrome/quinol oxidase subunit 3
MNARQIFLFQLTLLYAAFSLLLLGGHAFLLKRGIDREVLLISNTVIYVMSIIAFLLQQKAMQDKNPQVFIRAVMATMMIRMLVCVVAVVLYKFFSGDAFSSTAVFISLFFYLIYLAVEVAAIMKLNKNKNG